MFNIMRKKKLIYGMAFFGLVLSACSESNVDEPGNIKDVNLLTRQDVELTSSFKEIAQGQYAYPVNLLKSVYETSEDANPMVSPLSASMVLSMIVNAIDEPADRFDILKTLCIDENTLQTYNEYNAKLVEVMPSIDQSAKFTLNNAFWLRTDGVMSQDYRTILSGHYNSELGSFEDFDNTVVDEINEWISGRTDGAINNLLSYEDTAEDIKEVWVNALYFKGIWRQAFEKKNTVNQEFYPSYPATGDSKQVKMMSGYDFRYINYTYPAGSYEREDAITTVMLPFGNESFIFTAVLPAENNPDIANTMAALTPEYWQILDRQISTEQNEAGDVIVKLPQLHLENTLDLIPIFKAMGIENIFDEVSMQKHLGYDIKQMIQVFRQKNLMDIDEEGGEIKSATVAEGMDGASGFTPMAVFDRPFIYFVRERSTGAVLLAGVYSDPR